MTDTFSPGEVAERSGFSLDTLRYYERIGLLDRVERTSNGHRRFDQGDLDWLSVLRCLRETGMPIAEMRRYAESARVGDATLTERMMLLVEHEARVERHIADLRAQQQHLRGKIDWYRSQLAAQDRAASASAAAASSPAQAQTPAHAQTHTQTQAQAASDAGDAVRA